MAPHSSTLAWKIPCAEEPGRLQSLGSWRVGHDQATSLSLLCIGEGNGNPLQCSCLESPRDGGAWWAALFGVAQSRTRLKQLSSSSTNKLEKWISPFKDSGAEWVFLFCFHSLCCLKQPDGSIYLSDFFSTFHVSSDTFSKAAYGLYHHICAVLELEIEKSRLAHSSYHHQYHNAEFNLKNVNVYTKHSFSPSSFIFGFKCLMSLFFFKLKQKPLKCTKSLWKWSV